MKEYLEALSRNYLDCGFLDLQILDDVKYDLGEILATLKDANIHPTLNAITDSIFYQGLQDFEKKVEEKLQERKLERDERDKTSNEYKVLQKQIDELEECDPENDICWFCNRLDTSIWFSHNEEIYRKYLNDEIAEVEDLMGFNFKSYIKEETVNESYKIQYRAVRRSGSSGKGGFRLLSKFIQKIRPSAKDC